jgi:hypothetical protein
MSELRTAVQKVMEKPLAPKAKWDPNEIPPMTHPLSSAWHQPKRSEILIDDTHAIMSQETFNKLLNYAHSQPSAVYEGKMYRKDDYLHWWGYSDKPDMCCGNVRKILIV